MVVAVAGLLAGCEPAVLNPQGSVGIAEKTILIDSLAIMLAIVVPTIAATLGFAWWFRASNKRATYLPHWAHSGRIELIVWGIPLLTIMLLGGVAWIGAHELDPAKPLTDARPIDIEVVSLDWKWLFIYPDQHLASVNELTVPAGRPIHFSLTSASVMNAFFIPQLGSMIYTMNGMTSNLFLVADQAGNYRGISSHFSGDGFADMHFQMHAVPASAFDDWVARTRATGPVLDASTYEKLAAQSANVTPIAYRDVDAALFSDIVNQRIAPSAGPAVDVPAVKVPASGPTGADPRGAGIARPAEG